MSLETFLERMTESPSVILNVPVIDEVTGEITEYTKLPIVVSDDSYRYRAIMGEHTLNLKFELPGYFSIPIGTYCEYQGLTYTLETPENIKKNGEANYVYDLVFQSDQYKLSKFMLRNIVPGDSRLKFSYTARPHEFMRLLVENMNARDPDEDWSFDEDHIVESFEKTVSFNHNTCLEALQMIAEAFETEWEVYGKEIRLRKVEYNKEDPLPMSYGRGNGFLPGLGRSEYSDVKPVERLFVQGGDRNIDSSQYRREDVTGQAGSRELLMPADTRIKFDGEHFDDEPEFDPDSPDVREYITDSDGMSVCRYENRARKFLIEDSLDASGIYPMREGTVAMVDPVSPDTNLYDFTDDDPDIPNYNTYQIDGEIKTVIFQTGMLTGREFDVNYKHPGHFEIVPQTIDGLPMPGSAYVPQVGDKYAIFHCMLPIEYIDDAELRMLKEAVKYLYDNEMPKFTFTGTMDSIWAKRDWVNIGGRLMLGGFIRFSDNQFLPDGMDIRITGIKDYVNNPCKPQIELSNNYKSGNPIGRMKRQINSEEVATDTKDRNVVQFAKRRFRDVQETMELLQNSMLNFSAGINPVYVNTMMMLVGEKGLQFDYSQPVGTFRYDPSDGKFHTEAGTLTHKTLPDGHGGYLTWDMPSWGSAEINTDEFKNTGYFVYAKVMTPGEDGIENTFMLSETAIAMNGDKDYYYLLVGILNSEFDGDRSFAQMYGFTEITPGRITTDRIVSADTKTYFDLARSEIGGNINFKDGLVSGDIGIGNEHGINAGLSGVGGGSDGENQDTDVRIWAGAPKEDKNNAPFCVTHGGSLSVRSADGKSIQFDPSSPLIRFMSAGLAGKMSFDNTIESLIIDFGGEQVSTGGDYHASINKQLLSMYFLPPGLMGGLSKSLQAGCDAIQLSFRYFSVSPAIDRQAIFRVENGSLAANYPELRVLMTGLPTSSSGLPSGALWRDGTTLRIVP